VPDFDTRTPREPDEPSRHRVASIVEKLRALLIVARSRVLSIANRLRSLLSTTTLRTLLIGGGVLLFVIAAAPLGLLIYSVIGRGAPRLVYLSHGHYRTINPDGSDPTRLPRRTTWNNPSLSPNGEQIAF